ncbi:uncharacterized protein LOC116800560 [Drosophila sechellia]|uniref:Uncharacterized protein, isoform B n=1 Tax=Drosophila simulans TaxID=7240 RepID=A0A0J9RH09_DROSI|nr:uncharacterized protein LOC27207758 isoform X1 [Drosophila simulans]XP_032572060.1 uncharacterized protein LOC116800560 [Drosophila sechellia]KMY95196.1 uncharacterized protein Dsimw501_GD27909, isoform B [Drosophila simulans]
MCLNANQKPCCVIIALVAIFVGVIETSYECFHLALHGMNNWLVAALIAWIPIFIAAIFLIIGALREIPILLLIWVIVSLICGAALIIIKIGLMIYLNRLRMYLDIVVAILNVLFLMLVFVWAAYPYAYMRDLKEQQKI